MTESKTETAGRLAWHTARLLLPASSPARAFPEWPARFSPVELAALQCPGDAAGIERRGLIDALLAAIKAGELEASTEHRSQPRATGRRAWANAYLTGAAAAITPPPPPPAQVAVPAITRPAFAAWFRAEPAAPAPSVHLLAWLGPAWQEATAPAEVKPTGKVAAPSREKRHKGDRLGLAITAGMAAYQARHRAPPTADALFEWLAEHDETGTIEELDSDGERLWWKKSDGNLKPITRKAFANRLSGIRARTPA